MAEVVTIVTGAIPAGREHEVVDPYREALSVWHRRADLEAMLASGEEPFARRLIRGAGGTPDVRIYDIVHRAATTSGG